ncbi:TPA: hypothetical protein ACH3X2_013533 [Trebouxia sp. C0005]
MRKLPLQLRLANRGEGVGWCFHVFTEGSIWAPAELVVQRWSAATNIFPSTRQAGVI